MRGNRLYSIVTLTLAAVVLGIIAQPAAAQLPGAIWTTTHNGRVVNGNIYKDKCDVYLNGGPGPNAPIGAAGLPEGWYYFMVTDPSGKVRLSSDAITERRIWVNEHGVFAEKVWTAGEGGDDREYPVHGWNDDRGEKDGFGAIVVQLCPYDDTPNNGGVYKAWVTPVDMYQEGEGKHGFILRWSKTDNFKVGKRPPDQWLYVYKFKDCNANGVWDKAEAPLYWDVTIDPPEGDSWIEQTPATVMAWPGEWNVTETLEPGWLQTALIIDGVAQADVTDTATVTFGTKDENHVVVFGNIPTGCITAYKFYDRDRNGLWEGTEPGIQGVKVILNGVDVLGPIEEQIGTTRSDGSVLFCNLLPGTYTVTEIVPENCDWEPTTLTEVTVDLACEENATAAAGFGNIITGTACFFTKGYWHNKNGLGDLTDATILLVNGLDPYATPSSYFDAGAEPFDGEDGDGADVPAAYNNEKITDGIAAGVGTARAEISHFLTDANAGGDPREQLAQQLLAFIFNVEHGIGGAAMIKLPDGTWDSTQGIIIAAIAAWSDGTPAEQTTIKNLLDTLNNRHCDPGVDYVLDAPPASCIPVTYPQ